MSEGTPNAEPAFQGSETDAVRITGGFDSDGTPSARTVLTVENDKRNKEVLLDHRQPIPVIFLPGVMGTLAPSTQRSSSPPLS